MKDIQEYIDGLPPDRRAKVEEKKQQYKEMGMKRYTAIGGGCMIEDPDGLYVKYEEAAEYADVAMKNAVETSRLILENELLTRRIEDLEDEVRLLRVRNINLGD